MNMKLMAAKKSINCINYVKDGAKRGCAAASAS